MRPLAALIVAAACVLGVTAGAADASVPAGPARAAASGMNLKTDTCRRVPTASGTQMRCVHVQLGVHLPLTAAQRAQRERSLTRHLPVSAAGARPSADTAAPAATAAAPSQCNFTGHGGNGLGPISYPDRFTSCSDYTWQVTTTATVLGQTIILGTLQGESFQWTSYGLTSTTWTHGMIIDTYKGTDALALGLPTEVISTCLVADNCIASPIAPYVAFFSPGSELGFTWTEDDLGSSAIGPLQAVGAVDTFDNSLGADVTFDAPGNPVALRFGGLVGRCDSVLAVPAGPVTIRGGCVDQNFVPTLKISLSRYGAAASMIQFAQNAMDAHWGNAVSGQPLQYLADDTAATANRAIICQDGTFVNQGTQIGGTDGDTDSCDEFPFAHTYQSGGRAGITSGSQCVEVTALASGQPVTGIEAADWPLVATPAPGTYNAAAPCVRGHIPRRLNSSTGGALGAFVLSQRLLDMDKFWVSVTA